MKILVTGGAGYIGSFMVKLLIERNYDVVVFDNLVRGHSDNIDSRAKFIRGDITNNEEVNILFKSNKIDVVMHFAGLISVEESEKEPEKYYQTNVKGSENLFEAALNTGGIKKFIFSSTAAVYGNPNQIPIPEDHPKNPTSKYGETKLATEETLLKLHQKDQSISFVSLRYFNACGASLNSSLGEDHNPETHIIPLAIKSIMHNTEFKLFGSDYNTPDGTCIRDYIHVLDLVEAHILSLEKIKKADGAHFFNVGTGRGISNREVLDEIQNISGKTLKIVEEDRRKGDADQLIADPSVIQKDLGFDPKYSNLKTIIDTAWRWHTRDTNL